MQGEEKKTALNDETNVVGDAIEEGETPCLVEPAWILITGIDMEFAIPKDIMEK